MKKISILMTGFLVITLSLLTSCDNDHYGPAPVDVTANYSNKLSNPNPNLILTYNGETMIGKSVDFSTVTGETAIVTLYDILPGEKELKMASIPLSGDEEGYSFSGSGMGENTLTSFRYEGRVTKGQLTLNISNLQMGNTELWANTYKLSDVINGPKNILEQDWSAFPDTKFQWVEQDGQLLNAPCYLNLELELTKNGLDAQTWGGFIQSTLGYILPQYLLNITLGSDGNISASYSNTPLVNPMKIIDFLGTPLTTEIVEEAIEGRSYTPSPKNLAYWYQQNGQFILKLNLPNIISQIASDSEQHINATIINAIIDAVSQMDAIKLKQLLITLNANLNNKTLQTLININDTSFQSIFNWLTNGIPMHVKTNNEQTIIYMDKAELSPLLKLLPDLSPVITDMLPDNMPPYISDFISQILDKLPDLLLNANIELGISLVPNK